MIDLADPLPVIFANLQKTNHSRGVVFDGDRDSALGIVQAKDLLDVYLAGEDARHPRADPQGADHSRNRSMRATWSRSCATPPCISVSCTTSTACSRASSPAPIFSRPSSAPSSSEHGPAEPAYVKRDDGSYLISGWMPALEFADLLGIALPASRPYQTFAGFLLQEFAAIPDVGDKISDRRLAIRDRRHGRPAHRQGAGEQAARRPDPASGLPDALRARLASHEPAAGLLITPTPLFPPARHRRLPLLSTCPTEPGRTAPCGLPSSAPAISA